jgi:hypothetical protein
VSLLCSLITGRILSLHAGYERVYQENYPNTSSMSTLLGDLGALRRENVRDDHSAAKEDAWTELDNGRGNNLSHTIKV